MNPPARIGRYELISRIGKSMTDVYLAMDTVGNRKAAVKLVRTDGGAATRLVLEAVGRTDLRPVLAAERPRVVELHGPAARRLARRKVAAAAAGWGWR